MKPFLDLLRELDESFINDEVILQAVRLIREKPELLAFFRMIQNEASNAVREMENLDLYSPEGLKAASLKQGQARGARMVLEKVVNLDQTLLESWAKEQEMKEKSDE